MSNTTINANSIYDRVIRIGRQTENLVSSITFNVNMWIEEYGAGECVLNVKRSGDGSSYLVPMTIADGMTTWTITDTDTAKKGRGEIQLVYRAGDKVKTSPIFTISCGESLVGGEVPEPYEDWLTELNRMTAEVEAAKTSADQSAQTAQTAAGTATTKATEAEQSANTASGFANNASASATSASTSAQAAAQSAEQAASSVSDVEASAQAASQSAQSAESAKQAAQAAESNAQGFAQTASVKASQAAESAAEAESAKGEILDARPDWQVDDETSLSYVVHRPAIRSGTANMGSIIEGNLSNTAPGDYSHAEGTGTQALGTASHAEGTGCIAQTDSAHAEGTGTKAYGSQSHAEGMGTEATNTASHSEGLYTLAKSSYQHVEGKYNVEDTNNTYAHIVGNGTSDSKRSNAHTLDWNGNAWYAGKVTAEGTPTESNDLVPKSYADKFLNAFPIDTASGSVASFSDGADEVPLKSLTVRVDPVQDLHGYDSPWPAGGKGNILPTDTFESARGITVSRNADGSVKFSGTSTSAGRFIMWSGNLVLTEDHVFSVGVTRQSSFSFNIGTSENNNAVNIPVGSSSVTVPAGAYVNWSVYVGANTPIDMTLYPMLKLPTDTDTTFFPYSNICPISGWTGAEVTHLGTNFWDEEWETGLISTSNGQNVNGTGIRGKNMCACLPNTTYYAHFESGESKYVFWYDESEGFISAVNATSTYVITSPANARFFRIRNDGLSTYNHDISVNYPSTDHDYHAYSAQTIPITFPSAAGTVYGGTLDVTNGVLTVDKAIVDLGTLNWTKESSYIYAYSQSTYTPKKKPGLDNVICDSLKTIASATATDMAPYTIRGRATDGILFVRIEDSMTGAQVKEWLSGKNAVYELDTPVTYQLTPTEIRSLLGTNNLWADTGDTSAEYRADPTLYITRKIAEAISALS